MFTLESSANLVGDAEALRAKLISDGYLYLPEYLDSGDIDDVRRKLADALFGVGWTAEPGSLKASRQDLRFDGDSFASVYPALQRIEAFHRLAHAPKIMALMTSLLQSEIFCHPAKVARISTPSLGDAYFTRAHQDFVVLHVASDVLTAWIPFSNCTEDRQGLRIIKDSHRRGYVPTDHEAGGARPLYLSIPTDYPRWMKSDYRVGDLVVFHSLTVHAGGPNRSDELRLSADVRYQRVDEPLRADFAHPHGWPRTPDWDDLCRGWETRAWIDLPDEVRLEEMPSGLTYEQYLATLTAPASRLLDDAE